MDHCRCCLREFKVKPSSTQTWFYMHCGELCYKLRSETENPEELRAWWLLDIEV